MRLAESKKRSTTFCNGFLRYIFSFHSSRHYRNDLTSYEQWFARHFEILSIYPRVTNEIFYFIVNYFNLIVN